MAAEKRPQPTDREIDAMRLEAVRKRLLAQEWAGTAMRDLTKAVARLHSQPPGTATRAEYSALAAPILAQCDQLAAAAEVAAASIQVACNERFELAEQIAGVEADVAREEIEVGRLRNLVERERRQTQRRVQYNVLAKLILAIPSHAVSKRNLDAAKQEINEVEKEIAMTEDAKDTLTKDLALFFHCVSSLDAFATKYAALFEGKEEGAMDTSA